MEKYKHEQQRLFHMEQAIHKLTGKLENICVRARTSLTADQVNAAQWLELIEESLNCLTAKVEDVCDYLGLSNDIVEDLPMRP
jgi:hypothetical protein